MAYTNIDDPSAFFHTLLWTGNGANNRALTNDANAGNFKPDWVWIKPRSAAEWHNVYDSSRGVNKGLYTNSTYQEESLSQTFESFDTNGFTVSYNSAYSSVFTNKNSTTYVAWQWKANGGTTSSNTSGGTTTTVQANQDAGFSIVTWTGNSSNTTLGHGLGVEPYVIIQKARGTTSNWNVYHKYATNGQQPYNVITNLNLSDATGIASNSWGTTASDINSSTFYLKYWINYNTTNVAYCFAPIQGYSKFGSYVGNGSPNGPFVYTGFKPAFIMTKRTDSAGGWVISDIKRSGYNGGNKELFAHLNSAEDSDSRYDLLSNGFKIRVNYATSNASGGSYIYMAFAENPLVTSTGVPTTAR